MTQPRSEPDVRASRLERLVGLLKLRALRLAREEFDAASDRATDAWGWRHDMQDRAAHQWPLSARMAAAREEMEAAARHLEAFANYKRPFKVPNA